MILQRLLAINLDQVPVSDLAYPLDRKEQADAAQRLFADLGFPEIIFRVLRYQCSTNASAWIPPDDSIRTPMDEELATNLVTRILDHAFPKLYLDGPFVVAWGACVERKAKQP